MRSREILGWLVAAGLLVAFATRYSPRGETISGTVRVVDGDSLHVGSTEIRLFGVDAFEGRQTCVRDGNPWRCGEAAANELRELTTGRAITCDKRDTDTYGRTVAVCSNGDVDVAAELARAGLALAYREFSRDYVDEENEARAARRGAWAGEFTAPWDARRGGNLQQREPSSDDGGTTSGCRGTGIKGNISRNSEAKIYHVPGSSSYEETGSTRPTASVGSAPRKTRAAPVGGRHARTELAAGRLLRRRVAFAPRQHFAERVVHGFGGRENLAQVRIDQHHVATLLVTLRVLATLTVFQCREVVFGPKVVRSLPTAHRLDLAWRHLSGPTRRRRGSRSR